MKNKLLSPRVYCKLIRHLAGCSRIILIYETYMHYTSGDRLTNVVYCI